MAVHFNDRTALVKTTIVSDVLGWKLIKILK